MKRYWKLFMIVPLIIGCLGTYYIVAAGVSSPQFYLELTGGDGREAARLTLQGRYLNEQLSIDSQGSEYPYEQPFWETYGPYAYYDREWEKLHKEHRQFMRGKGGPNSFYEDDRMVGYVNIEQQIKSWERHYRYRFHVAVYDKMQKHTTTFEVVLTKANLYSYIRLNDIQIVGQTMKVLTVNHKDEQTEVHRYIFNLEKGSLMEDKIIYSVDSKDMDQQINIEGIHHWEPTKASRYGVFQVSYHSKDSTLPSTESTVERKLFVYDQETNQEPMMIQGGVFEDIGMTTKISQSSEELFMEIATPTGPRIIRYSLAENKVTRELAIATGDHQQIEGSGSSVANNLLYMLVSSKEGYPGVIAADLDTGRIVYQGVISRKDQREISNLTINSILLK